MTNINGFWLLREKCNIITMPPKVINQIDNFGKSSYLMTVDTVKGFLQDSKKSKFKI